LSGPAADGTDPRASEPPADPQPSEPPADPQPSEPLAPAEPIEAPGDAIRGDGEASQDAAEPPPPALGDAPPDGPPGGDAPGGDAPGGDGPGGDGPLPASAAPPSVEAGRRGPPLFRGLAALAVVGASLGGFAVELSLDDKLVGLADKNALDNRGSLLTAILGGGAGLVLVALVYYAVAAFRRTSTAAAERIERAGMLVLPLSLVIFLPLLFRAEVWKGQALEMTIFVAAMTLTIEAMSRRSLAAIPDRLRRGTAWIRERTPEWVPRYLPLALAIAAAVGYALFASYYTILHHRRLQTACYDLGQYDNLFFNASVGRPFTVPSLSGEEEWGSLKGHAEIGMYALLPFYMLKPGPETLLVIQATLLGSAAVPLFLLGRRLVSPWTALLIALAYVIYGPLHSSNFYDFHMQPVAAAFTLWMLYFFVAKRNVAFWITFLLTLTMREDISIGLACFGGFLMLSGYRARTGFTIAALSVTYFVTLKFVVMPRFGSWWFANIYKDLQIAGDKGYGSVVKTLLSNPLYVFKTLLTKEKLLFALQILTPLAFLPVRRSYLALSIVPGFLFTVLTSGYAPTVTTKFQYNTYFIPYIFPATLLALRILGGSPAAPEEPIAETPAGTLRRRAALVAIVVGSLVMGYRFGAVFKQPTFVAGFRTVKFAITPEEEQTYGDLQAIVQEIPAEASAAATEYLSPHVSSRPSMYCIRSSMGKGDYILIRKSERGKPRDALKKLLTERKLGLVAERGDFYLFKRGADPSRNDEIIDKM
jgi:uncharacterized membrane protein